MQCEALVKIFYFKIITNFKPGNQLRRNYEYTETDLLLNELCGNKETIFDQSTLKFLISFIGWRKLPKSMFFLPFLPFCTIVVSNPLINNSWKSLFASFVLLGLMW